MNTNTKRYLITVYPPASEGGIYYVLPTIEKNRADLTIKYWEDQGASVTCRPATQEDLDAEIIKFCSNNSFVPHYPDIYRN